jgi:hypothetical protein
MAEDQRSAADIRQDIERTRAEMDETVDAIGRRLTPGQIVDDLWGRLRHTDAPSAMGDAVREHPLPLALIGAGLAWLAYDRVSATEGDRLRRKHGDVGPGTYERAEGRVGPYRGDELGFGDSEEGVRDRVREAAAGAGSKVSDAASGTRDRIADAASGARDRIAGAASSVGDRASDARAWASERMHRAGDRAGAVAGRARHGLDRTLEDQPLALGAVAFGLGLASGVAVPPTRWEDERLGHTADRVKDEARRTGREAADGARRVASETGAAVRDVMEREGLKDEVTDHLKQVAQQARDAAKQAARDAADREGLTGSGLRDRAREATERVRE